MKILSGRLCVLKVMAKANLPINLSRYAVTDLRLQGIHNKFKKSVSVIKAVTDLRLQGIHNCHEIGNQ
jgi:hypothetical protein